MCVTYLFNVLECCGYPEVEVYGLNWLVVLFET